MKPKKQKKGVKAWAVFGKNGCIGTFTRIHGDEGMEIYGTESQAHQHKFQEEYVLPCTITYFLPHKVKTGKELKANNK